MSSANGSPIFAPVIAAVNFSRNASYSPSTTMKRFGALHDWPLLSRRALDRGLHSTVEVVRRQQDERVGSAELERDLLEVASRDLGDGGARALRARDRDAVHARVGDDGRRLVVGGVDVDVRAGRQTGILIQLLDRRRRLGALRGVLEEDRVADHQVRRREAGDLVVREVPRHDPEQHADGAAADDRGALAEDVDGLVARDLLGVVGVVLGDVGREVDLAECRRERLAHLAHDDRRELVAALAVQLRDAAHQRGALGDGGVAPLAVGGIRRRDRGLELGIRERRVGGEGLARGGVDDGVVGHVLSDSCGGFTPGQRLARRRLAGESIDSVSPRKKAGRLIACQIMITIPSPITVTPRMNTSPRPPMFEPLP